MERSKKKTNEEEDDKYPAENPEAEEEEMQENQDNNSQGTLDCQGADSEDVQNLQVALVLKLPASTSPRDKCLLIL